jgi:hypothetical protein
MRESIMLGVVIAGAFALAVSAPAGTPKGNQLAENHQQVAGTTSDVLNRSVKTGSPKASQWVEAHQTAVGTRLDVDFVHATRPTLSPKDSRFETAWRENAVREFQIARLK